MDTSQRPAVSESQVLDLSSITNETRETDVDSAFSILQTRIKDEIEKNREDGLNFLKSGRFLRLKMEGVVLWALDKIIREGRIPNLDYDAISKYYAVEVEGRQTTRNSTFLRTKYLAFEAPIASVLLRVDGLTRDLMKVMNPKTRQPKKRPSKVGPDFGKGKLPTVYIEDSNSSVFAKWRSTIKLEDTVYAEIEKITDPELLSTCVQLCLAATQTYLKEKSLKLALFGALTAAFFHQFKLMRVSSSLGDSLQERKEPENLDQLSFKLANEDLTSEQVAAYLGLLSKKPRDNLSSKVVSRQTFMSETEAKNLLKIDHMNCCLMDYLVYSVNTFGSASSFSDKTSLIQAVSTALPQGFGKDGFRSLSYYVYEFKASELDSLWRSILDKKGLKSQDFDSTLTEVKKLLDLLSEAKKINPWLALVAFTEGDEFLMWGSSGCKKKLQVRIQGKKKAEIKLANICLKKGQLIRRLVAHLAQSVDMSEIGAPSFFASLSRITKVPREWVCGMAWKRHFQNLGSGFRVAILVGYFAGEDFESKPEVSFIREVCPPSMKKKSVLQKLSIYLLQDLAQHGDMNKTRLLYNRLKYPFFETKYAHQNITRSLERKYMRLIMIALDDGARLHSELAAHTGDKRQYFVDFVFLNHLRSLEFSDASRRKQDLRGIVSSRFGDLNPWELLSLMVETTESGKSPLYDFTWKEMFCECPSKPRIFPVQWETPIDIAGGLAKFAILLRVMEITFGFSEEELTETTRKYAASFKAINVKTANLPQYVLGTAEGCFQNTDILGFVYLPFMRGAMHSMTQVKLVRGYLQFLVKFYEDPEGGNGVDEDFIGKVMEELRRECKSEELNEQYASAVVDNLPIDHRLIDSDRLKNLRILSNSCTVRSITRTRGEISKKPAVTCEELKQLKKDNSLGSALTRCSSEVLKEYTVFCCETEDTIGLNALFGCIIQKRLPKVLQFYLQQLTKGKDHHTQNIFSKILYSNTYPFFSSNEQSQEPISEAKVNRNLVNSFYPSFSILLTELSVQKLGSTVSRSATALSDSPLVVSHPPSTSIDISTIADNCKEFHSGPSKSELIRSGLVSTLADVLPYLIEAVDPSNTFETSILQHSMETEHKLVASLRIKPDMNSVPVRWIHGISDKADKFASITAIKELSSVNRKKASTQLIKLFNKVSVNERRILIDEIVKKDLLTYALPVIVFLKPFLNDLKQLSNSITNIQEVYETMKQMVAPANGTQAGYYVLNLHNKFIYRPFFYGDKPSSPMDNNMIVPLAVRAGLALYFFGADDTGREAHEDFLKFIDNLLDHSKEARKGVALFYNEIDQKALEDIKYADKKLGAKLEANFSGVQKLFDKVFSFGTNLDRSSVPNFKFLLDFKISSYRPLKNFFFDGQEVKFTEKLMTDVKQRQQADREKDGDILIDFSTNVPGYIYGCLKLIEHDVADALDKFLSCSSLKFPFPALESRIKKRRKIIIPSNKVLFLQSGDPILEDPPKDVVLIEVASAVPGQPFKPTRFFFTFQDKVYSLPLPQRAPVKNSDPQHPSSSSILEAEISFRENEVKELVLSRITAPLRSILSEEVITSLYMSKSAEDIKKLKQSLDKKQRKFLNAFSGENDWYLRRDLELCHLYFKTRDELKQHKANLDFSGFKKQEETN